MDSAKMITRINNLEAVAELLLDECRKTKKELEGANPSKPKRGSKFTEEDAARQRASRRMRVLGHV